MNSKDIRNLQEAYNGVYDGDLKEEQEFKSWVTELLDEGYDLSDYTWNEMYDIYNEAYKGGPEFGMKYSKSKPLSGEKGDGSGYGGPEKFTKPDDKIEKPGTTVPPFKKGGYGRIMSNIPHGIGAHRDKIASKITTTTGGDPGAPTSQKMRKKKNLEIIRKKTNEEYDLYDIILSHLLDEGYADTVENAESIMVNMSEDWRDSIFEQVSTVASSGGAGGKVTVDKPYPATLSGNKGVKSTDSKGTEYFAPYQKVFGPQSTITDLDKAQYKQGYSGKYENIPPSQSTKNPLSHISRSGVPRVSTATRNYGIDHNN